jgi:hypothetical protein
MKQKDVSSTRNALRLAQQAEETGRDTLARYIHSQQLTANEANLYIVSERRASEFTIRRRIWTSHRHKIELQRRKHENSRPSTSLCLQCKVSNLSLFLY